MTPLIFPLGALAAAVLAASRSGQILFTHASDVEGGRPPPSDYLDSGARVTFRAHGATYLGTVVNWDCSDPPRCWNDVRIDFGPQPIDFGRVLRLRDDQIAMATGPGAHLEGIGDDVRAMPLHVKVAAALAVAAVGAFALYGGGSSKAAARR